MYKNSFIIGFFLIVAQLLGILRERLLIEYIGIGTQLDIYNAAFKIPDLLFGLIAGLVSASTVVPFISKAHSNNNHDEKSERLSSVFFTFMLFISIVSIILIILMPILAKWMAPNLSTDDLSSLTSITRLLLLQPFLLGLSTLISNISQIKDKFILFSIAPILYTLGNIIGIVYLHHQYGLYGVVCGAIIGACAHLLLQSFSFRGSNVKIKFSNFKLSFMWEHIRLAVPRTGSYVVSNFRNLAYASFALTLGPSVLSVYTFAQKLIDVPVTLLMQSLGQSSLPSLSMLHQNEDFEGHKKLLFKNLYLVIGLSSIGAIIFYFASELIAQIIYGTSDGINNIGYVMAVLSPTIVTASISYVYSNAFNSKQNPGMVFLCNLIGTGLSFIAYFILKNYFTFSSYLSISITIATMSFSIALLLVITYYFKYLKENN